MVYVIIRDGTPSSLFASHFLQETIDTVKLLGVVLPPIVVRALQAGHVVDQTFAAKIIESLILLTEYPLSWN